jgi:hypothetical protein
LALAGCTEPVLESDDLAYTEEVIAPYLDATDMRTAIECLYGDSAGRTLGFTPRGLSANAGLALALQRARTVQSVACMPAPATDNWRDSSFQGSYRMAAGH